MNKFTDNLNEEISIPRSKLAFQVFLLLLVPTVLLFVGALGQLDCFEVASGKFPFWVFAALGAAMLLSVTPFAFSLRQVFLSGEHLVVRSFVSGSSTISLNEMYSVDVSCSAPTVATIKLFDGSKVRYVPQTIGLFGVGASTRQLILRAEANRKNSK